MPESPFTRAKVVISTEVFEGPLDLLLVLLERRKLFINDISLKKITEDFISYIQEREVFPAEEGAHFIHIASTLVLMKSRSLLPNVELTEEEEEDIELLEERLAVYQLIQTQGEELENQFNRRPAFKRKTLKDHPVVFSPDQATDLAALGRAIDNVLEKNCSEEKNIPQAQVRTAVKLETVIQSLIDRIQSNLRLSFNEFTGRHRSRRPANKAEKIETVVSFIALLELVRKGLLEATQGENDIQMEVVEVATPRYH